MADKVASDDQSEDGNLTSERWRPDIAAFEKYLGELTAAGRVPDKQALAKRVTVIPGGGPIDSEVVPVTDGAGGFIDMKPAKETVQFQVNEALKDTTESFGGVISLTPKSVQEGNGVPFLSTLLVSPVAREMASFSFKAGDIVKLEGVIGDFVDNEGMDALQSPSGPVAIYHLDAVPHTVFWVGLTNVTISSTKLQTTVTVRSLKPSADVTSLAKALLRASFQYDEQAFKTIYAPEVRLLPGHRLFQFGLELPGKMSADGVLVQRDKMLPALKRQSDRDPIPAPFVETIISSFRIEQLAVSAGEFAAELNQPNDSMFGELRFTIEENDVLVKISVPGAFRYLQLRKSNEAWTVVAEY
jgi:hypothetical protein